MLRRVLFDVDKDSEVVFYYAGHGVQIAGGNYLVPVDADTRQRLRRAVRGDIALERVNIIGARARLQIVILDSCRDNPFGNTLVVTDLSSGLSETRDGFNVLTAPINSLLAFSTSPGTVAYDGTGANSPFTEALVETATPPDGPSGRSSRRCAGWSSSAPRASRCPGRARPWCSRPSFRLPDGPGDAAHGGRGRAGQGALRWCSLTMGQAAVAERSAATAGIVLAARRWSARCGIGAALREAIGDRAGGAGGDRRAAGARAGWCCAAPDGLLEDATRVALTGADLGRLVYVDARDPVPAAGGAGAGAATAAASRRGGAAEHRCS